MDIAFLINFAVPVIMGICLCVGYLIKQAVPKIENRFIPVISAVLGLVLSVWIARALTPEIILQGLMSGLASTGLYEAFRNLINNQKGDDK